jgi:hypothetical protein
MSAGRPFGCRAKPVTPSLSCGPSRPSRSSPAAVGRSAVAVDVLRTSPVRWKQRPPGRSRRSAVRAETKDTAISRSCGTAAKKPACVKLRPTTSRRNGHRAHPAAPLATHALTHPSVLSRLYTCRNILRTQVHVGTITSLREALPIQFVGTFWPLSRATPLRTILHQQHSPPSSNYSTIVSQKSCCQDMDAMREMDSADCSSRARALGGLRITHR